MKEFSIKSFGVGGENDPEYLLRDIAASLEQVFSSIFYIIL